MKVRELVQQLRSAGYADDQYWIGNDRTWQERDDCLCLRGAGSDWEMFYTERGTTSTRARFDSEDAAVGYYYRQLQHSGPRPRRIASVRNQARAARLVEALVQANIQTTADSFFDGRGATGLQYRVFVGGLDFATAIEIRDQLPSGWIPSPWGGEV
jgi:hypothetical protein